MKIGLGTVQLGLDYGINNSQGKPEFTQALEIVEQAYHKNIELLDTALAYGNAEEIISRSPFKNKFKIVTKVAKGKNPILSLNESLTNMQLDSVYGLLLHHSGDLSTSTYEELCQLKESKKVKKIGISIYDSSEVDQINKYPQLNLIQLPINIFDQRLIQSKTLNYLKNLGFEIHARSIFLQGLVFMDPSQLPPFFDPIRPKLILLRKSAKSKNCSLIQYCLQFAHSITELDYVVLGVNSSKMLLETLNDYISSPSIEIVKSDFQIQDPHIIDPRFWPKK